MNRRRSPGERILSGDEQKKTPIKNITPDAMSELCTSQGQPPFRARQITEWLYIKNVARFDDMTNLPKPFREHLKDNYAVDSLALVESFACEEGSTRKYLFAVDEGDCVETVAMRTRGGGQEKITLCISTQLGCAMDCSFCASAAEGFRRNLSPAEIIDQVLIPLRNSDGPLGNIMIMGMGEPLLNMDGLRPALDMFTSSAGLALSPRRITVSTAGVVPGIDALAEVAHPPDLAISLHACTDELRSRLMPINKKFPIHTVVESARRYRTKTKADVTIEYVMLENVNDDGESVEKLAELAATMPANVNLLPFNETPNSTEQGLCGSTQDVMEGFQQILRSRGVKAFIRTPRGREVLGACGQLRLQRRRDDGERK